MADFGSSVFEKFTKINDKTFFHSSNGFVFRKDQRPNLNKMAAKNQNGVIWPFGHFLIK
jgi:hypothetical protein